MRVIFYKWDRARLFFARNKTHETFVDYKINAEIFAEIGNFFYCIVRNKRAGGVIGIAEKNHVHGAGFFYVWQKIVCEPEVVVTSKIELLYTAVPWCKSFFVPWKSRNGKHGTTRKDSLNQKSYYLWCAVSHDEVFFGNVVICRQFCKQWTVA